MEINVYDFDRTIYNGDSSVDFFLFTFKKYPLAILRIVPKLILAFLFYFCKRISKKKLKETFFSFLPFVPCIEMHIQKFWEDNYKKIKPWYLEKADHSRDVVISASPEFLLEIPISNIGVYKLIASIFDKKTGKLYGENCYGIEKVNRIEIECKNCLICEFYTDSFSDKYLAQKAKKAFWVKGNIITDFHKENM